MPAAATDDALRLRTVGALAGFYVASFAVLGVYMQFFPVWLQDARGCSAADVTQVLTGQVIARTIAGPLWARRVDASGHPRRVLRLLAVTSVVAFATFLLAHDKLALLLCSTLFGLCYPPMHPILDALTMRTCTPLGVSFGRVRIWGSVAFLTTIVAVGVALPGLNGDAAARAAAAPWVYGITLLALCGTVAASITLPDPRAEPARRAPLRELLSSGWFLVFLIGAGLIQGSHAAYYNLSTLHWRDHGVGADRASVLWAEGIVAEILLFAIARRALQDWRPTTWLLLGAVGAVVRWVVLAGTTSVPLLLLTNWLHAASFGCTFLGSLQFIQRRVAYDRHASAQGLLGAACSGVFTALGALLAGQLYERSPAQAFLAMAAMAGAGAIAIAVLRHRGTAVVAAGEPSRS